MSHQLKLANSIEGPVAVIGDVHGQIAPLKCIVEHLLTLPDFADRWVVLLGDLVDRGPDPKAAVDLILELLETHPKTTAICGNHDLALASSVDLIPVPGSSNWSERWLDHYEAQTTFTSYEAEFPRLDDLKRKLPESHRQLFANLPWCVEHPDYLFVHSGLNPDLSFNAQLDILRNRDYSLRRPQWLCEKTLTFIAPPEDCPFTVVSGHAQVDDVTCENRRLLCDTSGGRGGDLSCVLLPEMTVLQSDGGPVRAKELAVTN